MNHPSTAPSAGSGLVVALVDDDPMWRFLSATALRDLGWAVEDFDSGQSLLAALPASNASIILIDALMPEMDGFATCRAIRSSAQGREIPILMLTSLDDEESIRSAYDAGATDFFIKSTHWVLLGERIRHLVRLGEMGRELDRSNAQLAKVNTAARTGTFDFDLRRREMRGSPGSFAVLGLQDDCVRITQHELMELIDPQDRLHFLEAIAHAVKNRSEFQVAFRHTPIEGGRRFLVAEGEPEIESDGSIQILRGLIRDRTEEQQREFELERLATRDQLTGLPNRTEFMRQLAETLEEARATSGEVHVGIFNLDRFTQFNETLGQAAGDELIAEIGRRIAAVATPWSQALGNATRHVDRSSCLARLPGDEFALMLHGVGGTQAAESLIHAVLRELRRACQVDGVDCFLSASVGLASFPKDADNAELLVTRADRAAREVKRRGRNDLAWYQPGLDRGGRDRIELLSSLHKAIERGEFELHFQPWVHAPSARVTGLEALVRWRLDGRLISPAEFIPLAEETGLIVPIGEWVLQTAAGALAGWLSQGLSLDRVAVNISMMHFERDSLLSSLREAMQRHHLQAGALELELTETCMVQDFERTLPRLEALIAEGARLAIDDFGTGYSSLAYLTRLPISKLKVDRAFVNQLGVSREGEAVCKAIVALGQSLGVQVLAEGVETPEQMRALLQIGCHTMQGYLFSKPVPMDHVPAAIRSAEQIAHRLNEAGKLQPADRLGTAR